MKTCIQNGAQVMDRDLDNVVVSVRLRGADAVRFWRVMDDAKARNPYIDKSDVIRELLGLDPPICLTAAEVDHFRGQALSRPKGKNGRGIDTMEITVGKKQEAKTAKK